MKSWRWIVNAGLLSALLASAPLLAQAQDDKIVPHTKAEMNFSFAPVVKKAAPAVVNIYTKQRVTVTENTSPLMNDPFFKQFFGNGMPPGFTIGGRPREQVISSLGSGVLVKANGMVVTSNHVIKDAQKITVVLSDKREFEAKVVAKDPTVDLAVLKIDAAEALPALELRDSDTLEIGDLVLAIGNPFGVGQTVTNGIISALARKAEGVSDYQFFIQTDAAINPGNSGGALVDMDGHLVGINTAIYSRSGGSQGIGFAIPSNMVRAIMEGKMMQGGRVVHPWLGISVQPVTAEIAESLGLKPPEGVIIKTMHPDSPLAKAGLKSGDVITGLNDINIANEHDLQYRLALAHIGETSKFRIVRDGKTMIKDVELVQPPESPKRDIRVITGRNPLNAITVANLSPALAMEIGMNEGVSGVVIVSVAPNEAGINIGLMPGDLLLEVNGTKITSSSQLEKVMGKADTHGWQIAYQRGTSIMTLTVRM